MNILARLLTVPALTAAIIALTPPALANSQKLPFVGKRYFNFYGGTGTGETITISKNGNVTIRFHSVTSTSITYRGKYRNPLPTIDRDASFYKIKGNKIYQLDKNKQLIYGCMGDDKPCVSELYK